MFGDQNWKNIDIKISGLEWCLGFLSKQVLEAKIRDAELEADPTREDFTEEEQEELDLQTWAYNWVLGIFDI